MDSKKKGVRQASTNAFGTRGVRPKKVSGIGIQSGQTAALDLADTRAKSPIQSITTNTDADVIIESDEDEPPVPEHHKHLSIAQDKILDGRAGISQYIW